MTHTEADTLLGKRTGKKLENNTRLERIEGGAIAVVLYDTAIVTIHPDNTFTLRHGGFKTVLTKDRIDRYSPANLCQKAGAWYVVDRSGVSHEFTNGMRIDSRGNPIG